MTDTVQLWPRALALALPAGLLGGALISQYQFGLAPCEMCHWQRWPHYAALVPALGALVVKSPSLQRGLAMFAALLIAVSGAIGVFHAGVEYGWWEGLTRCAMPRGAGGLDDLLNAPITRCDVAPWTLAGISLAGYNAILSLGGALAILMGLRRTR
jgi:disulfide bond formation protein DsbB